MVLEDVTEMYVISDASFPTLTENYSDPAEGNVKLPKILLNGNNICMVTIVFPQQRKYHN